MPYKSAESPEKRYRVVRSRVLVMRGVGEVGVVRNSG